MEEDERRETAIASAVAAAAAASLDPKSKSSSSVSQARLSKFQVGNFRLFRTLSLITPKRFEPETSYDIKTSYPLGPSGVFE